MLRDRAYRQVARGLSVPFVCLKRVYARRFMYRIRDGICMRTPVSAPGWKGQLPARPVAHRASFILRKKGASASAPLGLRPAAPTD